MKKSELAKSIKEEIFEILSEETADEINAKKDAQAGLNKELEKTAELTNEAEDMDDVEMDKKAAKAAKKGDSVSKIANKLRETDSQMKSIVKKWKDSEEPEKSKLLTRLKELTKIKKELEGLL